MPLMFGDRLAVGGGDAGRTPARDAAGRRGPVDLAGRVGMAVDGHDAAFFAELVGIAGALEIGREQLSSRRPECRQFPKPAWDRCLRRLVSL
jgi:hypothetical protein